VCVLVICSRIPDHMFLFGLKYHMASNIIESPDIHSASGAFGMDWWIYDNDECSCESDEECSQCEDSSSFDSSEDECSCYSDEECEICCLLNK